jgi:hypothetical protein
VEYPVNVLIPILVFWPVYAGLIFCKLNWNAENRGGCEIKNKEFKSNDVNMKIFKFILAIILL